jgi:hypothetical protein
MALQHTNVCVKEMIFMARPIEPTPILKGKDAERFLKRMEEPATPEEKEFLKKAIKAYKENPFLD